MYVMIVGLQIQWSHCSLSPGEGHLWLCYSFQLLMFRSYMLMMRVIERSQDGRNDEICQEPPTHVTFQKMRGTGAPRASKERKPCSFRYWIPERIPFLMIKIGVFVRLRYDLTDSTKKYNTMLRTAVFLSHHNK